MTSPADLSTPADKEGQADLAYSLLKKLIRDNDLPAGAQLLELEAAKRLGMSRTPVREAMVRLRHEGIVEIRPRHGMRVLPVSPTDMRDIYDILTSLEATAAKLVAQNGLSKRELAKLNAAVRAMDAALEANDLLAWASADEEFHRALVGFCGNARLIATVDQFWAQAHRARMVTLRLRPIPTASNREHEAVVQAIAARDADAAQRLHYTHRERAGRMLIDLLERLTLTQI